MQETTNSRDCKITVKGFSVKSKVTKMCAWIFKMENKDGITHEIMITNT